MKSQVSRLRSQVAPRRRTWRGCREIAPYFDDFDAFLLALHFDGEALRLLFLWCPAGWRMTPWWACLAGVFWDTFTEPPMAELPRADVGYRYLVHPGGRFVYEQQAELEDGDVVYFDDVIFDVIGFPDGPLGFLAGLEAESPPENIMAMQRGRSWWRVEAESIISPENLCELWNYEPRKL